MKKFLLSLFASVLVVGALSALTSSMTILVPAATPATFTLTRQRQAVRAVEFSFDTPATGTVYVRHGRGAAVVLWTAVTLTGSSSVAITYEAPLGVEVGDTLVFDTTNTTKAATVFVTME